jgi:hypothetical protein
MSMVRRWHVPPVIGKIESGVPTIEVVAAADYDAVYRLLRLSWSVDDIERALQPSKSQQKRFAAQNRGAEHD